MKVLADTCIWSASLRRHPGNPSAEALELQRLIVEERILTIGPIRQEILSGVRHSEQFERIQAGMSDIRDTPLLEEDFILAARYFNECQRNGVHASNYDLLICAVATRLEAHIFTVDKDFERLAAFLPITLHQYQ